MPKPIVDIRNARIVSAEERGSLIKGALVLVGELGSKHPVLGEPAGAVEGDHVMIITSLIVEQRLSKREVETLNTIYRLV